MSPLDSIRYYKRFLHAGPAGDGPGVGRSKAWVGGINYKHFKYDHVRQGRRQPGSAFKPIVYAAAIANMGYTPCTEELDAPITIGGWTARNYSRAYSNEPVTLRQALGQSLNTVPARIVQKLGVPAVLDYAKAPGHHRQAPPLPGPLPGHRGRVGVRTAGRLRHVCQRGRVDDAPLRDPH
jgi:penicillin-binding protein 1A